MRNYNIFYKNEKLVQCSGYEAVRQWFLDGQKIFGEAKVKQVKPGSRHGMLKRNMYLRVAEKTSTRS